MFEILNQVLKAMKEHPLPLSVAANFALIALLIMALNGWTVSYTEQGWQFTRTSLQQQVAALFTDGETRELARGLLNKHGYYEITNSNSETEAITRALRELGAEHKLVNDLREMSHKNKAPFEPRKRTVTLSTSSRVARGEATVCESDADELQTKFIEFFSRDNRNGMYVEATRTRRCRERSIVEVNPADWRTLDFPGDSMAEAEAQVYLHRPYERRADDAPVVALASG